MLPDEILDLLAVELKTQYYREDLPQDTKRELIRQTIPWYMQAGTPSVIREYLGTVFDGGKTEEWFSYGGKPYYFRAYVYAESHEIPLGYGEEVKQQILAYKNVRSWLEYFAWVIQSWYQVCVCYQNAVTPVSYTHLDVYKRQYLDNVESFINGSRAQVLEIQYAMQLNLEGLAGEDETGTALKEQFSRFYTDQYEELTRLGDELGQVVGDAFEDGMLDIDEARAIQELQQKMSRITSALAVSEFDANMQVITEGYAGNLDAESFQNLQAEMMDQVEVSEKKLKESLTYGYAGLNAQLNSGSISQDEYDLQHEYLSGQYQTQLAEVQAKAVSYQAVSYTHLDAEGHKPGR